MWCIETPCCWKYSTGGLFIKRSAKAQLRLSLAVQDWHTADHWGLRINLNHPKPTHLFLLRNFLILFTLWARIQLSTNQMDDVWGESCDLWLPSTIHRPPVVSYLSIFVLCWVSSHVSIRTIDEKFELINERWDGDQKLLSPKAINHYNDAEF